VSREAPSDSAREPVELLVRTFFAAAAKAFQPLVVPTGKWAEQLSHASPRGLELTTPDRIHGFFLASCEFQTRDLIGEITFGDREFFLNTVLGPRGRSHRYALWEWADALDRPALVPHATDWVMESDRLRSIVDQMADATITLAPGIAGATAEVVERIEAARASVRAASQAQLRESEHQGAVHHANEAFRLSQWSRVVELLESVENLLTRAEAEKLAYARKRNT
jgi:hypothetical protein